MGAGTFAIGAASSILGFEQQQQNANRQNAYAAANYQNTVTALTNTYAGANNEVNEERAAGDQQLLQNEIKGTQAQGAAITAGGQAGIDGSSSLAGVLQDFDAQQGRQDSAVQQNFQTSFSNTQDRLLAAQTGGQARVNAVPNAAQPSFLTAGLGIASAGFQGASTYYKDTTATQPWKTGGSGGSDLFQSLGSLD